MPAESEGAPPAARMVFSENSTLFEIEPSGSEARFLIDEILQGEDKRVIGKTNQISGQVAVDFENPSSSAVGPIKIDALTLETDSALRNRAIQSRILLAASYEFITFTPEEIVGLPGQIVFGEEANFEITGDLTITTYTQPITFTVSVIPLSESRLEGQATAVINRADFDLRIPSAPGVAGVSDLVTLQLDFTATAAGE